MINIILNIVVLLSVYFLGFFQELKKDVAWMISLISLLTASVLQMGVDSGKKVDMTYLELTLVFLGGVIILLLVFFAGLWTGRKLREHIERKEEDEDE